MKKMFCIAFVLVALVLIPPVYGSPAEELEGDQWITNTTEWTNRHIVLTGNLFVSHGGTLILDNTTIEMNCSYEHEYRIVVDANGKLIIKNSHITTAAKDITKPSNIWLKQNSSYSTERPTIQAEDSTFSWLGHLGFKRAADAGGAISLWYTSTDCWFRNCTFENCTGTQIYLDGRYAYVNVYDCLFKNQLHAIGDDIGEDGLEWDYNGYQLGVPKRISGCLFEDFIADKTVSPVQWSATFGEVRLWDVILENINQKDITTTTGGGWVYNINLWGGGGRFILSNIVFEDNVSGHIVLNREVADVYIENLIMEEPGETNLFGISHEICNVIIKNLHSNRTGVFTSPASSTPSSDAWGSRNIHGENLYAEASECYGFIFNSENATFRNVTIDGQVPGIIDNSRTGIKFTHYHNNSGVTYLTKNCIFEDFEILGEYIWAAIDLEDLEDNVLRDILINADTPQDIRFLGGNNKNNKFINLKYDPAKIGFDNDHDEFTPFYYLDVLVQDQEGNHIPNANVTITNEIDLSYTPVNRKGESKTIFTTGSDGHTAIPDEPTPVERYSDYFELDSNADYDFGGWMKIDKGTSTFVHGFLILYEYDADNNLLATHNIASWYDETDWVSGGWDNFDWTEKDLTFTTKSNTVYGRVKLDTYSKGGSAWFDDIYVNDESDTNILPNPGFELGSSTPDNWDAVDVYRGFWSSDAHSGSKSYNLVWSFDWPNDEAVACICDYVQTSTATTNFNYNITVDKDGDSATVSGINPDESWYRSDPNTPHTVTIILSTDFNTTPDVSGHTPDGTNIPVDTTCSVTFTDAMNTSSAESASTISPSVNGSFAWDGNEMIFIPDSTLDYETTYVITINTTAESSAGTNLAEEYGWQFTTISTGMDLVGEWHFDEGTGTIAEDTSGNNNDGALTNMDPATDWVAGKNGTALQFDGVNDYVDCGNNPVLDIADAITIETWLKPNIAGEGGINAGPVCKAEADVDWSWQLRYNAPGGYMGFQFNGDPDGSTWVSVKQNLTPGEWYHIAGTFDGTTLKCYLNGIETDTNQISAIKSGNAKLFIGQDGWGSIFNGAIDELKIYNRALTTDELLADYEAGLNGTANTLTGTVTGPVSNGIADANVTLVSLAGDEIGTTLTDSNGHYTFTGVSAGFYNINASKPDYWSDSDPVNVTAEWPTTANITLCMIYDYNADGVQADAGDLAKMGDATVNITLRDWTYDLDGDGEQAEASDLAILKDVCVGATGMK